VSSFNDGYTLGARAQASLERSRSRREVARRLRRRALRIRASSASMATVAVMVAVVGTGAAVGAEKAAPGGISPGAAATRGLLVQGSSGAGVTAVQRALGIRADGAFGASTKRAVLSFQRRRGLLVDGIVGPQTRAALGLGGAAPASPSRATGSGAAPAAPAATGAASGRLQRIAQCESGGNPRAVSGTGRYRGKYQFSRETWAAVGGSGDPAAAPEAEQDRRAAILLQRSGSGQWPNCG
jgi:hypothetical protein